MPKLRRVGNPFARLLFVCAAAFLGGRSHILLLNPKGPIGDAEHFVVVTPVFVMNSWFARKYRASNTKSIYMPKWSYSGKIDLVIWAVPIGIVAVLAILAWSHTHRLNPYRPLQPGGVPVSTAAGGHR
jgi:cytochrome o ubiquinol oxidase subunit 2